MPLAAQADPPADGYTSCTIATADALHGSQRGVLVDGVCKPVETIPSDGGDGKPVVKTQVIGCGTPKAGTLDAEGWKQRECGTPKSCVAPGSKTRPGEHPQVVQAFVTQTQDPESGEWVSGEAWCPSEARPKPDLAMLRDRAISLLPKVPIGVAPPNGNTLVNTQTILWANTPTNRALDSAHVVGQLVRLRIRFDHAEWAFGDGAADTSTNPGKAYDHVHDQCRAALCPDYFGHVYKDTGAMQVSVRIYWTAQFSLDGGANWTDIGQDPIITNPGRDDTLTLHAYEARSVLVPDPGPS